MKRQPFRLATYFPALYQPYQLDIYCAIRCYCKENNLVLIHYNSRGNEIGLSDVPDILADGWIAYVHGDREEQVFSALDTPVINVSNWLHGLTLPRVLSDEYKVSQMVAEHFIELGHRLFGFVGYPWHRYSDQREHAFRKYIREAGFTVESFSPKPEAQASPLSNKDWNELFIRWLTALRTPIALMCADDNRARRVINVCEAAGLHIPQDIAVMGVNNDFIQNNLSAIPISCVVPDLNEIGRTACKRLVSSSRRTQKTPFTVEISPLRIIVRESSDLIVTEDQAVSKTLQALQRNFTERISIAEIAKQAGVSRRALEYRFRKTLHTSIHAHISDLRYRHARELLLTSKMRVSEVADECGLDPRKFSLNFAKRYGMPPRDFRSQEKQGAYATQSNRDRYQPITAST